MRVSPGSPALSHLCTVDALLAEVIGGFDAAALAIVVDPARGGRYPDTHAYGALVRVILGQQVSVGAARSMVQRLTARFDGGLPTPEQVLADDPATLRSAAGLSHAKFRFVRGLADEVASGRLDLDALGSLDDDAVLERLCAVTGIGPWTAHVFLMGHLRRPDVLAPGDLGLRKAAGNIYAGGTPITPDDLVALGERWRPHRSTASRVLWKSLDAAPVGIGDTP